MSVANRWEREVLSDNKAGISQKSTRKAAEIAAIVVLVLLFAGIAVAVKTGFAAGFEDGVYTGLIGHMSPTLTACMIAVTSLGDTVTVILVCVALIVASVLLKRGKKTGSVSYLAFFATSVLQSGYALPVCVSTLIAAILNAVLKQAFARPRPDMLRLITETGFGFPSGHAMINMALYATIALLAWRLMRSRKAKVVITVLLAALVCAIGLSRIYLGVHYATDVFAGWCLGLAIACAVVLAFDKLRNKT